jgi:cytidyltransferase-like protein
VLSGAFDDLRSAQVRLLQEAARLGPVHVLLWSDEQVKAQTGRPPKFSLEERRYLLEALRYVERVSVPPLPFGPDTLPQPPEDWPPAVLWAVGEAEDSPGRRAFAAARSLEYRVIHDAELHGFPAEPAAEPLAPSLGAAAQPTRARLKVIVSGCFDWFHSGHVRFFEEASALGELHVVIGHDANVRLLKGQGHPLFPQEERRYLVAAVRHVHRALVSSGDGWLDAEPEIRALRPDSQPREGLPRRQSTDLRGY